MPSPQVTRVREPLDYYLSYYKWTIVGRQLRGLTLEHGATFLEWAPTNLQANLLLYPNLSPEVELGNGRTEGGDHACLQHFNQSSYDAAVQARP